MASGAKFIVERTKTILRSGTYRVAAMVSLFTEGNEYSPRPFATYGPTKSQDIDVQSGTEPSTQISLSHPTLENERQANPQTPTILSRMDELQTPPSNIANCAILLSRH